MANRRKGSFGRAGWVYFRRFRMAVWLLILAVLGALIYLNQAGLPGFAKTPLLNNLRARGLDLQFSRLRLSWYRGIVAENVRFVRPDAPLSPQLTLAQVQVRLNLRALARLQIQTDALRLRKGRLVWPVAETHRAPRQLVLDQIQSELRFLPGDEWALDYFTAVFAGAKIRLSGTVTNASAVRHWTAFQAEPAPAGAPRRNWPGEIADVLERIHFSAPPEFELDVRGDARVPHSFTIQALLNTPEAHTPWGRLVRGRVNARLFPAATNDLSHAELNLEAGGAQTRWATATNLSLNARLAAFASLTNWGKLELALCAERADSSWASAAHLTLALQADAIAGQTNLVTTDAVLTVARAASRWGGATNAHLHAQWMHSRADFQPLSGTASLHCAQASNSWATARELQINARLAMPGHDRPLRADESWGGWAALEPYALEWEGRADALQSPQLRLREVACAGQWRAPTLALTRIQATLAQQSLGGRGDVDVSTRRARVRFTSSIDPHELSPLLTGAAGDWLARLAWETPPTVAGEASLVWPAWTNRQPDWQTEVLPTLRLQADLNFARGLACQGVAVSAVQSHISCSNQVWRLPDLRIIRPEGQLEAAVETDLRTREYHCRLHSSVNVLDLRPLLAPDLQRALRFFTFAEPPVIDARVWGRWDEPRRTGLQGRVALTNFTFRGESASYLQTALQYTNHLLHFTDPRLGRGAERLSADAVTADFAAQKIYLSNGFSTGDPLAIARAIGPHVARVIHPYQFAQPPVARVWGIIPMHGEDDADLHFDLRGGAFAWWRLRASEISGHVHWLGQHLSLSNIWAGCYGGQVHGSAQFDFHPGHDADYQFTVTATNALLPPLVADLFLSTNHLDGRLNGTLAITRANTADINTWTGSGDLTLRDGLIWDVPIFGLFSQALNSVVPRLGYSRASAGRCTFGITNGVISSEDLEIRSTGMRLQYRGTLDFQGQVNARAEAELLRDAWLVGPLVSTVLWPVTKLFEYKITGTLGAPKGDPVYLVPKVVTLPFLFPFRPLRTLRGLFPESSNANNTNPPPVQPPETD